MKPRFRSRGNLKDLSSHTFSILSFPSFCPLATLYLPAALECESGFHYNHCGSECVATCSDPDPDCDPTVCVEGTSVKIFRRLSWFQSYFLYPDEWLVQDPKHVFYTTKIESWSIYTRWWLSPSSSIPYISLSGCFCPEGKLFLDDTCVAPSDCVCVHEGEIRQVRSILKSRRGSSQVPIIRL